MHHTFHPGEFVPEISSSAVYRAKIPDGDDIPALPVRGYPPPNLPRIPRVKAMTRRATVSVIPRMIM